MDKKSGKIVAKCDVCGAIDRDKSLIDSPHLNPICVDGVWREFQRARERDSF